jgi:predicted RNase H-like HicB family nuclease
MKNDNYTYKTEWSIEDNCFVSKVLEFPSLSAFGDTPEGSRTELNIILKHCLEWMEEDRETIPVPKKV